jgi:hypothetical protein
VVVYGTPALAKIGPSDECRVGHDTKGVAISCRVILVGGAMRILVPDHRGFDVYKAERHKCSKVSLRCKLPCEF